MGELAKLIGYKLRPGLAASAALSFTMDSPAPLPVPAIRPRAAGARPDSPPSGSPASIALATGTQAQSVPDPGAQPATFETDRPHHRPGGVERHRPADDPAARGDYRSTPAPTSASRAWSERVKVGDSLLVAAAERRRPGPAAGGVGRAQDTATKTTLIRFEAGPSASRRRSRLRRPGCRRRPERRWMTPSCGAA